MKLSPQADGAGIGGMTVIEQTQQAQQTQRPTVMVVDDEIAIVKVLRDFLEAEDIAVLMAQDGDAALALLAREPVDCLLLDVMMPGADGFDVCRQIRATTDVPILFLTAREGDSDKLRGFRLGADDYIVKSATPDEVVARVKAVLRRARPVAPVAAVVDDGVLDFGRLVVDTRAHEVRVAGVPIALPAREFALLRVLAEHPRQAFSRDHLLERVWDSYGDRTTVAVHIRRLREKIEEDPADPRYIVTVWGMGYRFEGVRR
ncbi:MAG: two component transcriptional regulator, winged helix family [Chloroflexi bacterium]|nr:two component transcriptional regulator, winged helix family [Chloroflexota bacterium]